MQDAIGGQSLLSIYGVYEKLKGKSTASTAGASSASEGRPSTPITPSASKDGGAKPAGQSGTNKEAEGCKSNGNAAMARKDYPAAIDAYSKAIALEPLNPVYLSNRAAAYSASHKHHEAQTDAEMAVVADPKYTKAWSRLGLARYVLGDAKGSMEAYAKGIEYEGNGGSDAMKKGFKTAKEKADEEEKEGHGDENEDDVGSTRGAGAGGAGGAGGMPDLASLAGMMGGGGGGGGAGGMPDLSALAGMMGGGRGGGGGPDLSSIMNNPMFANMAQNLMSNPGAMSGLMNNPQIRQMAERFGMGGAGGGPGAGASAEEAGGEARGGAGGGGMPDLGALLQDPNIAEMWVHAISYKPHSNTNTS